MRCLTGTVDEGQGTGTSAGQFETRFVDAVTVAGGRIALDRLVIADRIAMGQSDLVGVQLKRPGPFHRFDSRSFTSYTFNQK